MINLIIFDLDGTLFDTAPGIATAFNKVMESRGEKPLTKETIINNIGTGLKDLILNTNPDQLDRLGDLSLFEEEFHSHYKNHLVSGSELFPGVLEFLDWWKGDLAIVSNKSEHYVRQLVESSALAKYPWKLLMGGDSLRHKKPHASPLAVVIELCGTTPEKTLMIGDGLPDMGSAQSVGARSVALDFGYDPISELIHLGADAHISHYSQLPSLIEVMTSN